MKFIRKLFGLETSQPPARGRERDFDLKGLERILHYNFRNPQLARQAVTHRSYLHATPGRAGESNERMEFLGDSVVGLVVNEFLYKKFLKLREGELTKMKSLLVSRVILSRAANQLGLGDFILLSDAEKGSGGRNRASILADTLEGVIGSVYLDGGIEPARRLTERLLLREVNTILSDANLANYKSMLQEYVQGEFKSHPQYRISSEYGPDHQKMFTVEVVVGGRTFGRGHGSNKKEAEQEAARDALFHFEKLVRPDDERGESRRRRRRGGRGRRNQRGGGRGEPVAGAEAISAGGGGGHAPHGRRSSERRDRDRERGRGREPRDRERETHDRDRDTHDRGRETHDRDREMRDRDRDMTERRPDRDRDQGRATPEPDRPPAAGRSRDETPREDGRDAGDESISGRPAAPRAPSVREPEERENDPGAPYAASPLRGDL